MNSNFRHDILSHGKQGKDWLDSLPDLVKHFEQKWNIKVGDPYELSYNYVAPAIRKDESEVVIKIVFPGNDEFLSELSALQIYNGNGSIKVIEADIDNSVILLEKAFPGTSLSMLENDEQETKILASVIKKLSRPLPTVHKLKPLADIVKEIPEYKKLFPKSKDPLSPYLIDKAEELINMLIATTKDFVVLHGDLHQGNILSSKREPWLAIDPKGLFGDPVSETGAMIRNPYPTLGKQPNLKKILTKRIHIMSEQLETDPIRIHQWGFVLTILSAVYRVESHRDHWQHAWGIAEILDSIKL